jgi:hypothetical protein
VNSNVFNIQITIFHELSDLCEKHPTCSVARHQACRKVTLDRFSKVTYVMSPAVLGPENGCAREAQQQL